MKETTIQASVSIESEAKKMVLAGMKEVKPSEQDVPGVTNSERIE